MISLKNTFVLYSLVLAIEGQNLIHEIDHNHLEAVNLIYRAKNAQLKQWLHLDSHKSNKLTSSDELYKKTVIPEEKRGKQGIKQGNFGFDVFGL